MIAPSVKKPYQSPALTVLGAVADLTRSNGTAQSDGGATMQPMN